MDEFKTWGENDDETFVFEESNEDMNSAKYLVCDAVNSALNTTPFSWKYEVIIKKFAYQYLLNICDTNGNLSTNSNWKEIDYDIIVETFFESMKAHKRRADEIGLNTIETINLFLNNTCIWTMKLANWQHRTIEILNWQVEHYGEIVCDIPSIEVLENKEALIKHINANSKYEITDII